MATHNFRPVPAWGAVGEFARVGVRKSATFPCTLPGGGDATVVQGGTTKVGYVESDANGLIPAFTTTDIPTVVVDVGIGPLTMHSLEAISAGAASASAAASSATAAAASASNAASSAASISTAVNGKVSKGDLFFNVKDYGAVGDKTTDDTAAIGSAIAAAQSYVAANNTDRFQAGATVFFPRGAYKITSTLTVDTSCITLAGDSTSGAVIYAPSANFDLVTFNHASVSLYNCGIRNLRFSTPGNATAGNALTVKRAIYFAAQDLTFNGWYGGVYLGGVAKLFLSRVTFAQEVRTAGTTAQAIKLASDAFLSGDVHLTDVQVMEDIATHGVNAIVVTSCDGLYINNSHWHGTLSLNPTNAGNETTLASVHLTGCYLDSSSADLVEVIGTAGTAYTNLRFSNCYFRQGGLRGLRIEPTTSTVDRILVSGCTFSENARNAIDVRVANVADMLVTGSIFKNNNTANGSGWGDVNLNGDGVQISNSLFSGGGATGYALAVAAAATDVSVVGVSFANSTAASKIVNAAGTQTSYKGVLGWKAKNKGVQSVSSGVTTSVVTHGLNITPTLEAIRLTPQANCPAYWVSTPTSTQFTINFASATGSAFSMGWLVDMEF